MKVEQEYYERAMKEVFDKYIGTKERVANPLSNNGYILISKKSWGNTVDVKCLESDETIYTMQIFGKGLGHKSTIEEHHTIIASFDSANLLQFEVDKEILKDNIIEAVKSLGASIEYSALKLKKEDIDNSHSTEIGPINEAMTDLETKIRIPA